VRSTIIHSLTFTPSYPLGRVAETASLGGLDIPHGQKQSQRVRLPPHQEWPKQSRRCNHSTWYLHDLWAVSRKYSKTCLANLTWDILGKCRTNVAGIFRFGVEVARKQGFYKFHSWTRCREVSHRKLSKDPISAVSLEIVLYSFGHYARVTTVGGDRSKQRLFENWQL